MMSQQQFHPHVYLQPQCYQSQYAPQNSNEALVQMQTLQEQLNSLQMQRDQFQKELAHEKQRVLQLQQQLQTQRQMSAQMQQQYEAQIKTLQLEMSKYKSSSVNQNRSLPFQCFVESNDCEEHTCASCQFRTKSEVSLLLHKMNHGLTQKNLQLPTTIFTTKNNNSSFLYKCPVCDKTFSRHEVYTHIYKHHTREEPHHCAECDLFFTHKDYLDEHQRDKHLKQRKRSPARNRRNSSKKNKTSDLNSESSAWSSLETIITSTIGTLNESPTTNGPERTTKTDKSGLNQNKMQPIPMNQPLINSVASIQIPKPVPPDKSEGEFKCLFSGCGFATNTKERLEFHLSAHKNSKYKCPYCPFVANVLVDIKRHIQKSSKHSGFVIFQCQKCESGTNCEKTFKEHLRQVHFGKEVTEKMINSFIDEMFANGIK